MQKLLYWMSEDASPPAWVHLERSSASLPLRSVLCSQLPLPLGPVGPCPIVSLSLKVWSQIRKCLGLQGPSILTQLLQNHVFTPSRSDLAFRAWHSNGIICVKDLYKDGIFASFTELSSIHNLPNSHLFRFFQIRDFVKKTFPHFPNRPPETLTDSLLATDPNRRKCISVLYES